MSYQYSHHYLSLSTQYINSYIAINRRLATTKLISSEEIKQMLENKIDEKRKEVRPHLFNQAYVEHADTELETLQSLWAEEKRKEEDSSDTN
jgi:hypothetical protein